MPDQFVEEGLPELRIGGDGTPPVQKDLFQTEQFEMADQELCACKRERVRPIPVAAEERTCPAFPVPPADLMQPPRKLDFLSPTN